MAAKALLASVRPPDVPGRTRRELAAELVGEIEPLDGKLKPLNRRLAAPVTASASALLCS